MQEREDTLNTSDNVMTMKEEDWECLGRSIGLQLRDLNKKSLTIVQKLIADAIYYAKIGRLTEDSYIALGSNLIKPTSSHPTNIHQRCCSSLSSHSPSPPLYIDTSPSPSLTHHQPSHQFNRIQLSCPSPQYHTLPNQSQQYQVTTVSKQSPQYKVEVDDSSDHYQLFIAESSQDPSNTTNTVIIKEENES